MMPSPRTRQLTARALALTILSSAVGVLFAAPDPSRNTIAAVSVAGIMAVLLLAYDATLAWRKKPKEPDA